MISTLSGLRFRHWYMSYSLHLGDYLVISGKKLANLFIVRLLDLRHLDLIKRHLSEVSPMLIITLSSKRKLQEILSCFLFQACLSRLAASAALEGKWMEVLGCRVTEQATCKRYT